MDKFGNQLYYITWTRNKTRKTQAPLLLFQGWMTPTTITATITKRIIMAMHIHFLEFFWSFFAFWSTVVPLWTWSTAVVTWTRFPLTPNTKQYIFFDYTYTCTDPHAWWCRSRNKPDFRCYLISLLEPRLRPPYQGKSDKLFRHCIRNLISGSVLYILQLWIYLMQVKQLFLNFFYNIMSLLNFFKGV